MNTLHRPSIASGWLWACLKGTLPPPRVYPEASRREGGSGGVPSTGSRTVGVLAALLAGLLLVLSLGCGSPREPEPSTSPGAQPRPGGVLRVLDEERDNWDPSYPGVSQLGVFFAQEPLLRFKAGPELKYAESVIEPSLAERWEVSPDGKTFTFHLRRGVRFANLPPVNGRELTAQDVKWSYEYLARSGEFARLRKGQTSWMFAGLRSVQAPDPYTVVVEFESPLVPFLGFAASSKGTPIVPHEIFDQDGHFKDRIVGTGPYQLDPAASQKGTRTVWKKNPSYWQDGKPYIDQVVALLLPEENTAEAAFKAKQLDLMGKHISVAMADRIKGAYPAAVVSRYLDPGPVQLYMNLRKPPLDNLKVRKAVSLATDREEFVRVDAQGQGAPALSGALPDYFSNEERRKMVPHDPAEARRLLAEAGYADGLALDMRYSTHYGESYVTLVQLLQAQFKKVGIDLTLTTEDQATSSKSRASGNFTFQLVPGVTMSGDIDSWIYASYHPQSASNYNGVNDSKLTAMLEAQRKETDPAKRRELIGEAVRYINTDQYWGIAVHYKADHHIWQPSLQNYGPNYWIGGNSYPVTDSWLEP